MRFLVQRTFNTLKAVDDQGREALSKIKPGKFVLVEVRQARNPRQHALYWALVDLIYQHQSRYATNQQVSNALKVAVGCCDEMRNKHGEIVAVPRSIAFGNMPQDEFEQFLIQAIKYTVENFLPVTEGVLRAQLEEMTGVSK